MIKKGLQSPWMIPFAHIWRRGLWINKQKWRLKIQGSKSQALAVWGPIPWLGTKWSDRFGFLLRLLWLIYQHAYLKGRNNGAHFYQKSLQAISNHFRAANFIIAEGNIDCNQMLHIYSVENWTEQLRSTSLGLPTLPLAHTQTYTKCFYSQSASHQL